jgi:conjugative transfer region protein (TIGR03750 family)
MAMKKMETPDLLATRLNFDAVVFCGCTMKEMQAIGSISLIVCIFILGSLMKALVDLFLIGVGLAFPTAVGLSWVVAHLFQRIKQGKPKGYWKQKCLLTLEDWHFMPPLYVRRSGYWSVGRNQP